ncbi:MAG: serine hydrolase [Anaerolineales bacterium]|nr:serine hydrolase [Anaerolineales bacterium]MCB8952039.1 serine hydrolase [Ardenticatenales bacterium]
MRRQTSISTILLRILLLLVFLAGVGYAGYQAFQYWQVRDLLPVGMTIAGIDVGGLTLNEAAERVNAAYTAPIYLTHLDEQVEIDPARAGFQFDLDGMMQEAQAMQQTQTFWQGFAAYLLQRPVAPEAVELKASSDTNTLRDILQIVADLLDQPAQAPGMNTETFTFVPGKTGYTTDIDASLPAVQQVLFQPDNRVATLVVHDQPPEAPGMDMLKRAVQAELNSFAGVGSVFVMDLETGEEFGINADTALSGLSILKVGIFVDAFRALNGPPDEYVRSLLEDTAIHSSDYGANLLLHVAAGENNTYKGADVFTESMHELGLVNTFMAVPYDAAVVATRPSTYVTPANSAGELPMQPDPARQSTAEDMGTLMSMIYYCSKGGGTLLAVYPDQITPGECQEIIDLMEQNLEGNLIRFGVPDGVPVSHKHGWDSVTHGDAGIVYSPGGDYVIVEYLHQSGDWLPIEYSFPVLREISRIVYNYFNPDQPFAGRPSTLGDDLSPTPEPTLEPTPEPTPESGN